MVHPLITTFAVLIYAAPAFPQDREKQPAAAPAENTHPKVEPAGGQKLPQVAQLRDKATRLRRDAEPFSQHASASLRNADLALKNISSGDAALKNLSSNPVFASAAADIKACIAKQQEAAAKHQAAAKADQDQAAKLLAQAQDLEKQAGSLEKPAPTPPSVTTRTPVSPVPKPGTKPPGKG